MTCEFKENDLENAEETHFMVNVDTGKTRTFRPDVDVKYVDVVSGGEAITMLVRISGGRDEKRNLHYICLRIRTGNILSAEHRTTSPE